MNALILVLLSRLKRRRRKDRDALPGEKEARARAHMPPGHPELLTRGLSDEDAEALTGIEVATELADLRHEDGGR